MSRNVCGFCERGRYQMAAETLVCPYCDGNWNLDDPSTGSSYDEQTSVAEDFQP